MSLEYTRYIPELKEGWTNGIIAFSAHPRILRKTPCYLGGGCHDKEHLGWRPACGIAFHKWELNFYRGAVGPNHYHCIFCGIADELFESDLYLRFWPVGPKVKKDWIERLEDK